jgi:hypothetical protein
MCYDERNEGTGPREAWSDGSTYRERTSGAKGKTINGQEGDMSGKEKRGTKWKGDGATDHVLIELDTACHDGTRSNFALCERAERGGPGRVPRGRTDGEGRTANDTKSDLRHQGVEGTRRRYGVETGGRRGESTEASAPGEGWKRMEIIRK